MIVTKNIIQGDFVEKYNIGLALDNCDHLSVKIKSYLSTFDRKQYVDRCNSLLSLFIKDQELLEKTVEQYIKV